MGGGQYTFVLTMFAVPTLAAALLLILAGFLKLTSPIPASIAMRGAGLPSSTWLVRLLGFGEVVLGIAAVVRPITVVLVAVTCGYLAFAVFCLRLLRRGDAASCGCFGAARTPVDSTHVIVNSAIALAVVGSIIDGGTALSAMSGSVIAAGGVLTAALLITLTALPQVIAATRVVLSGPGTED